MIIYLLHTENEAPKLRVLPKASIVSNPETRLNSGVPGRCYGGKALFTCVHGVRKNTETSRNETDCLLSPECGPKKRVGRETVLRHEMVGADESVVPTLECQFISNFPHDTLFSSDSTY